LPLAGSDTLLLVAASGLLASSLRILFLSVARILIAIVISHRYPPSGTNVQDANRTNALFTDEIRSGSIGIGESSASRDVRAPVGQSIGTHGWHQRASESVAEHPAADLQTRRGPLFLNSANAFCVAARAQETSARLNALRARVLPGAGLHPLAASVTV
jgi:hypothetical protein